MQVVPEHHLIGVVRRQIGRSAGQGQRRRRDQAEGRRIVHQRIGQIVDLDDGDVDADFGQCQTVCLEPVIEVGHQVGRDVQQISALPRKGRKKIQGRHRHDDDLTHTVSQRTVEDAVQRVI